MSQPSGLQAHLRANLPLIVLLLVYGALGVLFAVYTPSWQAPDEPAHFNYVRHIVISGGLPVLEAGDYDEAYLNALKAQRFPAGMPIDSIRYEGHQPPLYYLAAALVLKVAAGATLPVQALALRLFGVLLGAGVVVLTWFCAQRLWPGRTARALVAAGFVAFLPMHMAMLASINNDVLAELLIAAVVYRLLGHLQQPGAAPRAWLWTGLLTGLGFMTKLQAYILAPLVLAVWVAEARQVRRTAAGWTDVWRTGLAWMGPAFALGAVWWLRNARVYGLADPLGLNRHDAIVTGQPRTADWILAQGWAGYLDRFFELTFRSFWGVFGWLGVFMDGRVYGLLGLLSLLVLAGLVWRWRQGLPPRNSFHRSSLGLLTLQAALVAGAYVWYNLGFVQHQGRYLFPALLPIALAFAIGLEGLQTPGGSRWGAGAALFLAGLIAVMGLAVGDVSVQAVALAAAAAAVLVLHSFRPVLAFRWWAVGFLLLLVAVDFYALFGAILSQLTRT